MYGETKYFRERISANDVSYVTYDILQETNRREKNDIHIEKYIL